MATSIRSSGRTCRRDVPLVDAILVNWNGRGQIEAAIDSLVNEPDVRVTVADNGSTDGSVVALVERYGERINVIENGANLGFGTGANRAIAATQAPFILLLNPDAVVHPGAVGALVSFMQAHPNAAVAGPKIFESDGRVAESCGEFDTWAGAFLRSSAWGDLPLFRRFSNGAALRAWDYSSERHVDLVIGAAMMIRRSALDRVGAFDERFFMYHEEIDLQKRLHEAGYEIWFVPQAQATHVGMGSSGGKNVERWKTQSRRTYWIKHHGRVWYYTLSAALVARFALYLGILAAIGFGVKRLLFR